MAGRTPMTVTTLSGIYPPVPSHYTFVAFDAANGMTFPATGREILIMFCPSGGPFTFTVTSTPDQYQRTKDITSESVANGDIAVTGPWSAAGWAAGGLVQVDAQAGMQYALVRLPFLG